VLSFAAATDGVPDAFILSPSLPAAGR
jgi:hypothetical protein